MTTANIIEVRNLATHFGQQVIHHDINFTVSRGETLAIVGGSGSGKTTLLRELIGLHAPSSGNICILSQNLHNLRPNTQVELQRRWGVLFQQNALFSSLTLLENVAFPLQYLPGLKQAWMMQLALVKLNMVGLSINDANKYPAELSGGMQKRAGLARALILDPELLFLDEPTAGLDPETSANFDDLILNLRQALGLTIVMITHDLDSLWRIADKVAFLGQGTILCIDTMPNLVKNANPQVQQFFNGPRGRAAQVRDADQA